MIPTQSWESFEDRVNLYVKMRKNLSVEICLCPN